MMNRNGLWALLLVSAGCQTAPTSPMTTGQPATPAPHPTAPDSRSAPTAAAKTQLVGTWANSQMAFHLAANGAYQWRIQGRVVQGSWAMPQPGVVAFTVNGSTTHYGYQVNSGQLGLRDPQGHVLWFARPVASTARPGPPSQPAPARPAPTNINMNDYNTQMWILNNPANLPAQTLHANWTNGMSVPTGSVYKYVTSGQLSYGSMGHGHMLEFTPDGTYAWAFRYAHNYMGCRNSVESMEVGRYTFNGRQLSMQPTNTDADICSCCAGRKTKMSKDLMPRTFQVAFHASGRYAVLRGTCTKAASIRCVGPANAKHLRIALTR